MAALRDLDVFFCTQNKNNMLWFYPQLASARGALNTAKQHEHDRFAWNWPPVPKVFNGLFFSPDGFVWSMQTIVETFNLACQVPACLMMCILIDWTLLCPFALPAIVIHTMLA